MIAFFAGRWMALKRWRSLRKARNLYRSPLPKIKNVNDIASYVCHNLVYTGDPVLGGLDDFYQHPEYLQYCIEAKINPPVDCDDYSALAFAIAKNSGDFYPQMAVIVVKDFKTLLSITVKSLIKLKIPYYPFHEGCFIQDSGKLFFIDTSGLWMLSSRDDVASIFEKSWGMPFIIIDTEYPFNS